MRTPIQPELFINMGQASFFWQAGSKLALKSVPCSKETGWNGIFLEQSRILSSLFLSSFSERYTIDNRWITFWISFASCIVVFPEILKVRRINLSSSKEKIDSKNSFQISELDREREREAFFPCESRKSSKNQGNRTNFSQFRRYFDDRNFVGESWMNRVRAGVNINIKNKLILYF